MGSGRLEILRDGVVVRVISLGARPLTVGRVLTNDVVLSDEDVSAHHAMIVAGQGGLYVHDLDSTNGTFVDEKRVAERAALYEGAILRLGSSASMRISVADAAAVHYLVLRDETARLVHVIDGERLHIGSDPSSHLVLAAGPKRAATLVVHANREVWLGDEEGVRPLEVGDHFELQGHRFCLSETSAGHRPTLRGFRLAHYPYGLSVSQDSPGGPMATLTWEERSIAHTITAPNRVMLLYVLGKQVAEDVERDLTVHQRGWCEDDELAAAIWGRPAPDRAMSRLSVLVHRVRREFDGAGFDPWFIEKRRGAIRLRLERVLVV